MNDDLSVGEPLLPDTDAPADFDDNFKLPRMTLRDYFAAKAIQGLLAAQTPEAYFKLGTAAYKIADAMMEARNE